jgi:uncharacterized protein (TIGR00255 family)
MASSMTGLGIGEFTINGVSITVELRSVNNRFLEVSCRMPSFLSSYEREVRNIIRNHIHRGKIYVQINIQGNSDDTLGIRVSTQQTEAVRNLLCELRQLAGIDEEFKLDHFLKFSEIFESPKDLENSDKIWDGVKNALENALKKLSQMRLLEGKALIADIRIRLGLLAKYLHEIEKLADKNGEQMYEKLLKKVKKLINDTGISKDRLYTEVALLSDKTDITEECVRLKSHNDLFTQTITKESVVGKKLTFLLQEMNREVNTISSKATRSEVSHVAVAMKEEIEKLREQVQNLE